MILLGGMPWKLRSWNLYPEGVFTDRSYEAVEAQYDIHLAQKIREYYEAYPMEREALINKSKVPEDEKKSE